MKILRFYSFFAFIASSLCHLQMLVPNSRFLLAGESIPVTVKSTEQIMPRNFKLGLFRASSMDLVCQLHLNEISVSLGEIAGEVMIPDRIGEDLYYIALQTPSWDSSIAKSLQYRILDGRNIIY